MGGLFALSVEVYVLKVVPEPNLSFYSIPHWEAIRKLIFLKQEVTIF